MDKQKRAECRNCCWRKARIDGQWECRRYPPTPLAIPADPSEGTYAYIKAYFPEIEADDYCGEWTPREIPPHPELESTIQTTSAERPEPAPKATSRSALCRDDAQSAT
jgi:hypothetical protein